MLTVLNMSLTASIVIVFVLLARLLLNKAPKVFSYALWAVVLFRLLCPVSISSDFSLLGMLDRSAAPATQHTTIVEYIPQNAVVIPMQNITPSVPNTDSPANDHIAQAPTTTVPTSPGIDAADNTAPTPAESMYSATDIARSVWLSGIAAMFLYSAVSLLCLRRKLVGAVRMRDNIYLADYLDTPFVMGLMRARIYLPSSLSEREQQYIILHEQQHIRRLDHIVKALAFLALCIHWFNPLVWLAFMLSGKDMEMSCDEAVMRKMGEDIRTEYSASLLSLATGRRIIAAAPLAFGEGDTKSRIKNVLNWKKPKLWVILIAGIVCIAVAAFCAGNPESDENDTVNDDMSVQPVEDTNDLESFVGYMVSNGFLYQSGDSVISVSGGAPVTIPMTAAQVTVVHNGREIVVDYSWTKHANALAAVSRSSNYSVAPLPRSDRYLRLILDGGYTYLIDTVTGEVSDPLSALDSEITQRLSIVNFSPDGQYAVISHHSGTECILLNCTTGEVTQLLYASDIYSISGHFLDETHIALSTAFEVGDDIRYSLTRYDITSGELKELPGQYTAKDRTDSAFLAFCDDEAFAYTFENGCLVIVDLMTWEKTFTNFKEGGLSNIFYCEGALAGVVHLGTVYILDHEGNARAVCKVVTENAAAAESESEQKVEKEVSTRLSEEELAYFAGLFDGENKTFTQMLLSCRYGAPEDIDFAKVFSEGVPTYLGWGYKVSAEEEAALKETMDSADYEASLNYDRYRIPASVMEELLMEYLGLSIADTKGVGLDRLTYLEEYDAYYAFSGTSERVFPAFTYGMRRADGTVELYYQEQSPTGKVGSPTHVLVLRPVGESYQFVANVQIVPLPASEPFYAMPKDMVAFWDTMETTGLTENEINRVGMTIWAFLSTHGAALTGSTAVLPSYELVAKDILIEAKINGMNTRYHVQLEGYYIHRCHNLYEVLDVEYDAVTETLTMTIREYIDIYYSLSRIEPSKLPIAETAVKHELVFTKSETGEFILTGRSNDWIYEYYNPTNSYARFG